MSRVATGIMKLEHVCYPKYLGPHKPRPSSWFKKSVYSIDIIIAVFKSIDLALSDSSWWLLSNNVASNFVRILNWKFPTSEFDNQYHSSYIIGEINYPQFQHRWIKMDDFYLQPNFDPTSLRVADLRRILLFHDVYFSSSAKKSELVSLFSNNITPRAKEILEENNKVSPTRPKIETIRRPKAQVQPISSSPWP